MSEQTKNMEEQMVYYDGNVNGGKYDFERVMKGAFNELSHHRYPLNNVPVKLSDYMMDVISGGKAKRCLIHSLSDADTSQDCYTVAMEILKKIINPETVQQKLQQYMQGITTKLNQSELDIPPRAKRAKIQRQAECQLIAYFLDPTQANVERMQRDNFKNKIIKQMGMDRYVAMQVDYMEQCIETGIVNFANVVGPVLLPYSYDNKTSRPVFSYIYDPRNRNDNNSQKILQNTLNAWKHSNLESADILLNVSNDSHHTKAVIHLNQNQLPVVEYADSASPGCTPNGNSSFKQIYQLVQKTLDQAVLSINHDEVKPQSGICCGFHAGINTGYLLDDIAIRDVRKKNAVDNQALNYNYTTLEHTPGQQEMVQILYEDMFNENGNVLTLDIDDLSYFQKHCDELIQGTSVAQLERRPPVPIKKSYGYASYANNNNSLVYAPRSQLKNRSSFAVNSKESLIPVKRSSIVKNKQVSNDNDAIHPVSRHRRSGYNQIQRESIDDNGDDTYPSSGHLYNKNLKLRSNKQREVRRRRRVRLSRNHTLRWNKSKLQQNSLMMARQSMVLDAPRIKRVGGTLRQKHLLNRKPINIKRNRTRTWGNRPGLNPDMIRQSQRSLRTFTRQLKHPNRSIRNQSLHVCSALDLEP